jgi:hypothetical protein
MFQWHSDATKKYILLYVLSPYRDLPFIPCDSLLELHFWILIVLYSSLIHTYLLLKDLYILSGDLLGGESFLLVSF